MFLTGNDLNGTRVASATRGRYYQSAPLCHDPDGAGGVLLADGTVSAQLGPNAHVRPDGQHGNGALPLRLDRQSPDLVDACRFLWTLA